MNILLVFPGFIIAFVIVLYYERKIRNISIKPKNKVHFYVARDMDGEIYLYLCKPFRCDIEFRGDIREGVIVLTHYNFKSFGLNKSDYDSLKWEDEPVEVFLNMED